MSYYIHNLDPIAFSIMGIPFPWYWLAYFVGYFWVLFFISWLEKRKLLEYSFQTYLSLLFPGFIIMLVGGKTFYILFYNLAHYLNQPGDILAIWQGGMSFHGALIASALWIVYYAKIKNLSFWKLTDPICVAVSLNIFIGRIANFINGELAGRVSDVAWAVVFPRFYDSSPRHPSQIYEALLEGLFLFVVLFWLRGKLVTRPSFLTACFLLGYGTSRFFVEFFRMPDPQIGYLLEYFTVGQVYCLGMVLCALIIFLQKDKHLRPLSER